MDNYIYLAHEPESLKTAVIDPAISEPVLEALKKRGWQLTHILNTHHHMDHVGGNLQLKAETGCIIVGPAADEARIPGIDISLSEGESYDLGNARATIFDIPGHTRGHMAYWFEESDALFCGDTLFSMGCGRLFEGTPEQMWNSLKKLRALPDQTRIYCAHEYTEANGRFAKTIEPLNDALATRMAEVLALRQLGKSTVPSVMGVEKETNPFLRADQPELKAAVGNPDGDAVEIFAKIRQQKDAF